MLSLEKVRLSELVDFSGIMLQKFDSVRVQDGNFVLRSGTKERRLKIKGDRDVVARTIDERYGSEELEFERGGIRLSELKELAVIDFQKHAALKDYIDDLVFALYFSVPLAKVGFEYAGEIKKACRKSQHYRITQS
jgi:hypothetical protein